MNSANRILACILLWRPLNCLLAALSAVVGALTAGGSPGMSRVCFAALSVAAVTAAGNTLNDLLDVEVDRINRPHRPLPSGRISPRTAAAMTVTLATMGICLGALVSGAHALTAAGVLAMLGAYSLRLQRRPLWGNAAVALMAAAVFPYGSTAVGAWGRSWIPATFAFLYHLGRELIKDIEDLAGDRIHQVDTLAVRWGAKTAARIASGAMLVLVAFTALPAVAATYGLAYSVPVATMDVLILAALLRLRLRPQATADGRVGIILKAGMLLGLLAVVLGELTR